MKQDRASRPSRTDAYSSFLSSLLRSGAAFGWREKPVSAESAPVARDLVALVSGKPVTAAG